MLLALGVAIAIWHAFRTRTILAIVRPPKRPHTATATVAKPAPQEIALVQLLGERRCLAEAMYYEARGEGIEGEMAVAEVVFHRLRNRAYPGTICGVVFEGAQSKGPPVQLRLQRRHGPRQGGRMPGAMPAFWPPRS